MRTFRSACGSLLLGLVFLSTPAMAAYCSIDFMSDGVRVGQVSATLDPDTQEIDVRVNLEGGYTFVDAQAHAGLSSSGPSIFPGNKHKPDPKKFSTQAHPIGSSAELVVGCSNDCAFDYEADILLAVHATVRGPNGKNSDAWSAGQELSPKKDPATYSACRIPSLPQVRPITVQIYDPGLSAKILSPRLVNLLNSHTATGDGLFLPDNAEQTSAAAGIKTAPATWACTEANQGPSYGQLYFINNLGQKQYLPAAAPSGVAECTPHKRIATIHTETAGDFAGYFSLRAEFDGGWNPDPADFHFSAPIFFDYVVEDRFGQTAEGTVKLVFDGRHGIPVEINITLQNIIAENNNPSVPVNVNERILLNPSAAPNQQVTVDSAASLGVQSISQSNSGNTLVVLNNPLGQVITSEVAGASSTCPSCPTTTAISAQVGPLSVTGQACDSVTGPLQGQFLSDCESLGSAGSVSVTTVYNAGGGAATVVRSFMMQVVAIE